MKAYEIKEFDVQHVQRKAALKTAKLLKIEYCDLMDFQELQSSIKEKDGDLFNMLNDFCSAYLNYYYFANTLNINTKGSKIDAKEAEVLKEHIRQKDELRAALVIEIKKRKKQN
jgi:hypothetical protein